MGGNRIVVEKMCHTSYCGELALTQILGEDLFTEIRLLVWGMAMTSISSQSNYRKARKRFPGIHVNNQEICTKVGKGGGAIPNIFMIDHENIWKTAANRSMPSPQNSLQFSKVLLFWPTSPVTQYVNYTLQESIIKLFILISRL